MKALTQSLLVFALSGLVAPPTALAQETPSKLEKAESHYYQDQSTAMKNYRKALAQALDDAARVEVYLLDFEIKQLPKESPDPFDAPPALPANSFLIAPYRATSKILNRRIIKAAEIAKVLPHLKQTVGVEENTYGALCHFPIHGIRVWDKDRNVLFESSFCYKCGNFFVTYPGKDSQWTGLSAPELETVMKELMPVPQEEIDRFQSKFGKPEKPGGKGPK